MLALLAKRFNDVDLADEAVQEALIEAAAVWPVRGVPANVGGWLLTVARRKALDRVRRSTSARRRTMAAAPELVATERSANDLVPRAEGASVDTTNDLDESVLDGGDEQLRLVLLCCHPALSRDAQVALTLRLVGGLTTPEIASAFLLPEATLAQRLVRAKQKIRDARIPLSLPNELSTRIDAVLAVLYLIFNEGYVTRGPQDGVVRVDLVDESLRLTRLLSNLAPEYAELDGLLSLELFHAARLATRVDDQNELVLLEDQDRTRWNIQAITEANRILHRAMARMTPGPFQMQALIAAHHANARIASDTDWAAIAHAYGQLVQMDPSPVVALNRAVAVAMADGPNAGLALLDVIDHLDRYHLFHAARGELLLRAGATNDAVTAFRQAAALTENPAEHGHLARRIAKALAQEKS